MLEKMDTDREERKAWLEKFDTETKAMRDKRMEAKLNACRKETVACQVKTEANPGTTETNPAMIQSKVEHREVPMEEAAGKSSEIRKKRHRGRYLAAGRCGKPKELTQGGCGSRGKLAATCRKVSHHASSGMA
jgi:hypothetical protein